MEHSVVYKSLILHCLMFVYRSSCDSSDSNYSYRIFLVKVFMVQYSPRKYASVPKKTSG